MHPQLPHISLEEMVTQPPYTYLEGGATSKGIHFPLQVVSDLQGDDLG